MAKIVVALGGNALGSTPKEQKIKVKHAAECIVDLLKDGHQLVISHGNGPQVGMMSLAYETANKNNDKIPEVELQDCTAMTLGYIGNHLINAIRNEMVNFNLQNPVVGIMTHIVVDQNDDAFNHPTKPIGSFYSETEALSLADKNPHHHYAEDSGRGYRRMVASPKPLDILEKDSIEALINQNMVLIAGGGGGIPMFKNNNILTDIPAVIDKDFASAKLAELIDADILLILTAIDHAYLDFGKDSQSPLNILTSEIAQKHCDEGHFAPGSMLPKVEASIGFAKSGKGKKSVIASLDNALKAISDNMGTVVQD